LAVVVADYGRDEERGVACFMDDFEACIAAPALPRDTSPGDPHHELA
jgi:hypothetical protein